MKHPRLIYVANVRMPNVRAHGIQIANTCEALGRVMDVTLVTPMFRGDHTPLAEHYGISDSFRHRKIFAIDIPGLPFRYPLRNITFFLSANIFLMCVFLRSLLSRARTVVYVRGEAVLSLIPLTFVFPIFFETHQIRNHESWYRIALRGVRGVVVVTDALKKKFVNEYGIHEEKILVARDAVDISRFSNVRRDASLWDAYDIPKDRRIVLYSGTLSEEKGVHTLARAAMLMPHVQVLLLGGTDAQIEACARLYSETRNLTLLGRVSHTDVPRYIAAADVLVLPDLSTDTFSNLYTSPMKLFEYMASGRPIVASRVPSLCEVLDESTATFFEPGKEEALVRAIEEILADPRRGEEHGERARAAVSAFTWEKRAEAIKAQIERLTSPCSRN